MSIIISDYINIEDIDLHLVFRHALIFAKMEECEEKGHVWVAHECNTNFDDFVFYETEQTTECMRCGSKEN